MTAGGRRHDRTARPYPDYLITLVGPGSGAGAGVSGAAANSGGSPTNAAAPTPAT